MRAPATACPILSVRMNCTSSAPTGRRAAAQRIRQSDKRFDTDLVFIDFPGLGIPLTIALGGTDRERGEGTAAFSLLREGRRDARLRRRVPVVQPRYRKRKRA